ncbi:MAG TPA: hypothetical protein VFB13_12620 [Reyranella sp.]|jgi:lysophospholipase L1-like esterase|nr:hypothetical protein [Reyranella sp.]
MKTSLSAKLFLVLGSVLVTLFVVEIACRLMRGPETLLDWNNIVLEHRKEVARHNLGERFAYDSMLGFVQRPGFSSPGQHFDSEGFRVMPALPADASDGPPIVATGDSFTQGDEVNDDQTWPADLQGILKRRTINAGVAAYGFDQTVLRTVQLAERMKPALLVVGFIGDDLRRAEMKRTWGVEKPYFERRGGEVVLHNVPVPPSPKPAATLSIWNWLLGWSVAFDSFLEMKGWQYEWVTDHERVMPRGDGEKVGCLLMQRLAMLDAPVVVVAQYDFYSWVNDEFGAEQHRKSQVILRCAVQAGLAAVDTYPAMQQAVKAHGLKSMYGTWHPNVAGYQLIAEQIAAEIKRRGMLK